MCYALFSDSKDNEFIPALTAITKSEGEVPNYFVISTESEYTLRNNLICTGKSIRNFPVTSKYFMLSVGNTANHNFNFFLCMICSKTTDEMIY